MDFNFLHVLLFSVIIIFFVVVRLRRNNKIRKQWREENWAFGVALGFPLCCVDQFCNEPPNRFKRTDINAIRYEASLIEGKFSGFIPCNKHALAIKEGKVSIFDLVSGRLPFYEPFPKFGPQAEDFKDLNI